MDEIVQKIKEKREFSKLPDSIVERVAKICSDDVKESRKLLRKYFGVFLTNKVLKGKGSFEDILGKHKSSSKRDYRNFYREIFSIEVFGARPEKSKDFSSRPILGEVLCTSQILTPKASELRSVIDLGCGVNGFSYSYLKEILGDFSYVGVEASGQLVTQMNDYFKENNFNGKAVCLDLFNIEKVLDILRKEKSPRAVFLFQVIDALENLKRDFSKEFILKIFEECEVLVISLSMESLGGKKIFEVSRKWLVDFLEEHFEIKKDFVVNGERVFVVVKRELLKVLF